MSWVVTACLLAAMLSLPGCAEFRGHEETINRGLHIQNLYRRQVLANLSRTMDDRHTIPSMTGIVEGTVQSQSNVSPKFTVIPLSSAVVENGLGLVTSRTRAGSAMGVDFAENLQHVWNLNPVTDPGTLRKLRECFNTAVYGSALSAMGHQTCRWRAKFIYSRSETPDGVSMHSLGFYGNNELLMTTSDHRAGVLEEFILAVMEIQAQKENVPSNLFLSGGLPRSRPRAGPVYPSLQ